MQPENAPQLRVTRSNCDKLEKDNLPNRYPQPTTFNRDVLLFPFTIGSDGNGHSSTVRALSEDVPPDPRHGKPVECPGHAATADRLRRDQHPLGLPRGERKRRDKMP